jgi:hypothetical protein
MRIEQYAGRVQRLEFNEGSVVNLKYLEGAKRIRLNRAHEVKVDRRICPGQ